MGDFITLLRMAHNLKIYELFISRIFHLGFSGWSVTETMESESMGKRRLLQFQLNPIGSSGKARGQKRFSSILNPHVSERAPLLRIHSIPEKQELTQTP